MIIGKKQAKRIIFFKGENFPLTPSRRRNNFLLLGSVLSEKNHILQNAGYLRWYGRNKLFSLVKLAPIDVIKSPAFRYFELDDGHKNCWTWSLSQKNSSNPQDTARINFFSRLQNPVKASIEFDLIFPTDKIFEIDLVSKNSLDNIRCALGYNSLDFTIRPGANIFSFHLIDKIFGGKVDSLNILFGLKNFQLTVPELLFSECICQLRSEYTIRKSFHFSGYENITTLGRERTKTSTSNLEGEPGNFWEQHEMSKKSNRLQFFIASTC